MANKIVDRTKYLDKLNLLGDAASWIRKWRDQVDNAPSKGIKSLLNFEEYVYKAFEAGIKDCKDIGRNRNQYQLGRIGDIGDYELHNCRFILSSQNSDERVLNGGSKRAGKKISELYLGKDKTSSDRIRKMIATKEGYTKYNCPGLANMAIKNRDAQLGRTKHNDEGRKITSIKLSKFFRLVSPNGEVQYGKNLNEFCELHKINRGNLGAVCRGVNPHAMGWTGTYITEENYNENKNQRTT